MFPLYYHFNQIDFNEKTVKLTSSLQAKLTNQFKLELGGQYHRNLQPPIQFSQIS